MFSLFLTRSFAARSIGGGEWLSAHGIHTVQGFRPRDVEEAVGHCGAEIFAPQMVTFDVGSGCETTCQECQSRHDCAVPRDSREHVSPNRHWKGSDESTVTIG